MEFAFNMLNLDYLANQVQTKNRPESVFYNEVEALKKLMGKSRTVHEVLEMRALDLICYDYRKFSFHIWALYNIANGLIPRHEELFPEMEAFFKPFVIEELCLYYLEVYTWNCLKGQYFFVCMQRDGLFDDQYHLIHSPNDLFLNAFRGFPETACRIRLEEHCRKLRMTEISLRKTKLAFTENILPYLRDNLSKSSLSILMEEYKLLDEDSWKGKWYIWDRGLFVDKLLAIYFEKNRINPEKMADEDEQKDMADFLFAVVLRSLLSGRLTHWGNFEELEF